MYVSTGGIRLLVTQFLTKPVETFLLPTDAHNVKKHRVIKTF